MANAVKYDRDAVVEKATQLYWEKGFHGTSMRNLQDVIDLRPGSIYAGFGSKEALFGEALDYYAKATDLRLQGCLAEGVEHLCELKAFVKYALTGGERAAPSGMCMLVKTVAELTPENPQLLAKAKLQLGAVEQGFAKVIAAAQANGELDATKDPAKLAQYLQIQLMGLRTYVCAKDGDAPIDELVNAIFDRAPFRD
jgi:AcrR family transcriptional regulator